MLKAIPIDKFTGKKYSAIKKLRKLCLYLRYLLKLNIEISGSSKKIIWSGKLPKLYWNIKLTCKDLTLKFNLKWKNSKSLNR